MTEPTKRPAFQWRMKFTSKDRITSRQDFTVATWGNLKKSALLNFYAYEASREAQSRHLPEGVRDIELTRSHQDILAVVPISEPILIAYNKEFAQVGYISMKRYSQTITVHTQTIETALTTPPSKPASPKKKEVEHSPKLKNLSLNSDPEELESLRLRVQKLEEEVQLFKFEAEKLKFETQIFKDFAQIFKLKLSSQGNLQEVLDGKPDLSRFVDDQRFLKIVEILLGDAPANAEATATTEPLQQEIFDEEYSFISLDDRIVPRHMTVYLLPKIAENQEENQFRLQIAGQIQQECEQDDWRLSITIREEGPASYSHLSLHENEQEPGSSLSEPITSAPEPEEVPPQDETPQIPETTATLPPVPANVAPPASLGMNGTGNNAKAGVSVAVIEQKTEKAVNGVGEWLYEGEGQLFPGNGEAESAPAMTLPEWNAARDEFIARTRMDWDGLTSLQKKPWKTWTAYKNAALLPWEQEHPQPKPVFKCDRNAVYRRLVDRRDWGEYEDPKLIQMEKGKIKIWCQLHTWEDLEIVLDRMTNKDTGDVFWRKPENSRRIDGRVLLEQTPKFLKKTAPTRGTFDHIPTEAEPQDEAELAAMLEQVNRDLAEIYRKQA